MFDVLGQEIKVDDNVIFVLNEKQIRLSFYPELFPM